MGKHSSKYQELKIEKTTDCLFEPKILALEIHKICIYTKFNPLKFELD